jgi:hypothetical protein
MRRPEWAMDEIGARELLISWEITRITFFQTSASCRAISVVIRLSRIRRWRRRFRKKLRSARW